MRPHSWTKPTFRELNLSAEIGMYFDDGDFLPSTDALGLHGSAESPNEERLAPTADHLRKRA